MRILFVIATIFLAFLAYSQEQSGIYYPVRKGKELYLSKRPFNASSGKIAIDALDFENSSIFHYVAKKNKFFGVIDMQGKQVLPFAYDSVRRFDTKIVLWKIGFFDYLFAKDKKYSKIQADSVLYLDHVLYYYKNGLCGLLDGRIQIEPLFKAIRPYQLEINNFHNKNERDYFLAVMTNGDYQLLDKKGMALLPKGVKQINEISFGIIRFFDGIWKYYLPKRKLIVSSFGFDVIFYSQDSYKKYNADRTQSTLYRLDENRNYTGRYDDYFPLSNKQFIAVRKGKKVGILNAYSETLAVPCEYEQMNMLDNFFGDKSDIFRCYKNNLCGLVNAKNEALLPIEYHNVQSTFERDYFIVYKNQKAGLVKRGGEVKIPIEYDAIEASDSCLILKKNDKYGLADYNGEILCPVEAFGFRNHFFLHLNFYEFSMPGGRELYKPNGKFYNKPYITAIFGNDCIKFYGHNEIDVLYLNEKAEVIETYNYKNVPSITLEGGGENTWSRFEVPFDELEENQLSGKFGKRFYTQRGMSVAPIYNTIVYIFSAGIIFGERDSKAYTHNLAPGLILQGNLSWNYLQFESDDEFSMNELINKTIMEFPSCEVYSEKGQNYEVYADAQCDRKFQDADRRILYSEEIGFRSISKTTLGSDVSIVNIEESDASLYYYYRWANNLGLMTVKPEDLTFIMNPRIGVKFGNPKYVVCEREPNFKNDKRDYFYTCPQFEEFDFYPEMLLKYANPKGSEKKRLEIITYLDESKRTNLFLDEQFFVVESTTTLAKKLKDKASVDVHPDFPGFEFLKNEFNLDYHHGMLVQRTDKGKYRLIKPDNTVVLDNLENARFITNGLYLIKLPGAAHHAIYSLEKNAIVQNDVVDVLQVFENYAQFSLAVSTKNLIFCSSQGEISVDTPSSDEPLKFGKNTTQKVNAYELIEGTTLKKSNLISSWRIKSIYDFYLLYSDKYFYVLDANFNLIAD